MDPKIEEQRRIQLEANFAAIIITVIILTLALAWNSLLYTTVIVAFNDDKSIKNRIIYALFVTAITIIIVISLSSRLSRSNIEGL